MLFEVVSEDAKLEVVIESNDAKSLCYSYQKKGINMFATVVIYCRFSQGLWNITYFNILR